VRLNAWEVAAGGWHVHHIEEYARPGGNARPPAGTGPREGTGARLHERGPVTRPVPSRPVEETTPLPPPNEAGEIVDTESDGAGGGRRRTRAERRAQREAQEMADVEARRRAYLADPSLGKFRPDAFGPSGTSSVRDVLNHPPDGAD
jgi:hypothetical protein